MLERFWRVRLSRRLLLPSSEVCGGNKERGLMSEWIHHDN